MLRLTLFCALFASAGAVVSPSVVEKRPEVDVDTVLRALGAPPCMRKCIDPFLATLSSIWHIDRILDHTEQVCKAHSEATACLKAVPYCDVRGVFATASSSVKHRCEKQSLLFARLETCMKGKTDAVVQKCDSSCGLRSNVTAFSIHPSVQIAAKLGGNVFIVSEQIGPMCGALTCVMPCITKELNAVCPLSGWLTLDMLLQPFEAVAGLIDGTTPALKDLILNKLDSRCRFAVDMTLLKQLRKGHFEVIGRS